MRWVGLVLLGACSLDLEIADTAPLSCERDADCPDGWQCTESISRCIRSDRVDSEAPQLVSSVLEPEIASPGTVLRLTLLSSESLAAIPVARLGALEGPVFEPTEQVNAAAVLRHTLLLVVTGDEAEGETPILVTMTDLSGNSATTEAVSVTIDGTPPLLQGLAWAIPAWKQAAHSLEVLGVTATTETETTVVEAWLRHDGGDILDVTQELSLIPHPTLPDRSQLVGDIALPSFAPDFFLEVTLADRAGNTTTAHTTPLPVDDEPPSDPVLVFPGAPTVTSLSAAVQLSAVGATAYRIDGSLQLPIDWRAATFPTETVVSLATGDGQKSVTAHFRDSAGNETEVTETVTLLLNSDQTPPLLLGATGTASNQMVLSFSEVLEESTAEDVDNYALDPALTISAAALGGGGQTVTLVTAPQAGGDSYDLSVSGLHDLAGNFIVPVMTQVIGFGPLPDHAPPDALVPAPGSALYEDSAFLVWTSRTGTGTYTVTVAADDPLLSDDQDFAAAPLAGSPFLVSAPSVELSLEGLAAGSYLWRVRSDMTTAGLFGSGSFDIIGDRLHVYCPSAQACDPETGTGSVIRPFRSVSRALDAAATHGLQRVEVAARNASGSSTYLELVQIRAGIDLYGGWNPTFTQRSPAANVTAIQGESTFAVIAAGIHQPTLLDGLRFVGGPGDNPIALTIADSDDSVTVHDCSVVTTGTGIWVTGSGSTPESGPLLDSCRIMEPGFGTLPSDMTGVRADSSGLRLQDLVVSMPNGATSIVGVDARGSQVRVDGGTIDVGGTTGGNYVTVGIRAGDGGALEVTGTDLHIVKMNNYGNGTVSAVSTKGPWFTVNLAPAPATISGITATLSGGVADDVWGVDLASGTLTGSLIRAGPTDGESLGVRVSGTATITNNTIIAGDATAGGTSTALQADSGASLTATNNILATGTAATMYCVQEIDGSTTHGVVVALHHNLLVTCTTALFRDADIDGGGADTSLLLTTETAVNDYTQSTQGPATSSACNLYVATLGEVGFDTYPTDLSLTGTSLPAVAAGGLDTTQPVCGPARNASCGLTAPSKDLLGADRNCPVPPPMPACPTVATDCFSRGGLEYVP